MKVWVFVEELNGEPAPAGLELLMDRLKSFKTNAEFLKEVAKGPMG